MVSFAILRNDSIELCFETLKKRDKIGLMFLFVVWQTDDWDSLRKTKFHSPQGDFG
jgi:hypothetical protein